MKTNCVKPITTTTSIILIGILTFLNFKIVQADDFYSLDHTFVYHDMKDCKSNEYYDINYFNCKRCESSFNLMPSSDSK